jgi:hypothetical protein
MPTDSIRVIPTEKEDMARVPCKNMAQRREDRARRLTHQPEVVIDLSDLPLSGYLS